MAEYIEREAAVEALDVAERFLRTRIPAADVVPVVRCKDCVHMLERLGARYCKIWMMFNGDGDDGFCNYGSRKDGDGNG